MTLSETLSLLFIICLCNFVQGLTDAEVKAELTKTIIKCTQEVPVDMSELMQLQALKVPKKTETKCLLACAYKKLKSLNDKGMYDLEQGYKLAELTKNGDEKRLENGRKLADICSKINDVEVSDSDKGCERAGLLFKCLIENAPKAYLCLPRRVTRAHTPTDTGLRSITGEE